MLAEKFQTRFEITIRSFPDRTPITDMRDASSTKSLSISTRVGISAHQDISAPDSSIRSIIARIVPFHSSVVSSAQQHINLSKAQKKELSEECFAQFEECCLNFSLLEEEGERVSHRREMEKFLC